MDAWPEQQGGEERGEPMVPVWAPNPAVPLTARILAYTFAALMLLAVVLAFTVEQSPDLPSRPDTWRTHTSKLGVRLPYPDGWKVDDDKEEGEDSARRDNVQFLLWQGGPVRVQAIVQAFEYPITPDVLAAGIENFERRLSDSVPHFRAIPQEFKLGSTELHEFAFGAREKDDPPNTGIWSAQAHGNTLVILIGFVPQQGKDTMKSIVTKMSDGVRFVEPVATEQGTASAVPPSP